MSRLYFANVGMISFNSSSRVLLRNKLIDNLKDVIRPRVGTGV